MLPSSHFITTSVAVASENSVMYPRSPANSERSTHKPLHPSVPPQGHRSIIENDLSKSLAPPHTRIPA
jgi:hypothetical protein